MFELSQLLIPRVVANWVVAAVGTKISSWAKSVWT